MITPLFFNGCNFHKGTDVRKSPEAFPYVTVPAMLSGQEASEYAASHFWNRYFDSTSVWNSLSDTLIGGVTTEDMLQAAREYLIILWSVPYDKAVDAQRKLMGLAESSLQTDTTGRIYGFLTKTMESALWDPQSELRNEGFYIPVAESIIKTGRFGDHDSSYYSRQKATCLNNSPGTKAADFNYTDRKGKPGSLYGTNGNYILLLFSNPGCPACREIISVLKESPKISDMVKEGELTLMSIYIDEDLAAWYQGLSDYTPEWITGYNHDLDIRDRLVYDVRAIPSLYLLDKEKKVIFKDISPAMLMLKLQEHGLDGYGY